MRILVTGGAGFIGSNFIRYALSRDDSTEVVNLDALTYSGNLENLSGLEADPRYRFVHGDICDRELVDGLVAGCEVVVNFAAESHVDRSILDSRPFVVANVLGTQALLDAVRAAGGRRFVQISTDEVYGSLPLERPDLKFTENLPLLPNGPYAATKAAADLLVRAYHRTHGLDAVITRCCNNFGPYQFPEKVIPLFITNLLEGEDVPLYGDGRHVRDWLHVEDHCEAVWQVLQAGVAGEVYNIGADNERSNLELTRTILAILGLGEERIRLVEDRPGHDRRYAVDSGKIRSELGWRPRHSQWPRAMENTVEWYRRHRDWWQRVRSGAYRDYYRRQYGGRLEPRPAP